MPYNTTSNFGKPSSTHRKKKINCIKEILANEIFPYEKKVLVSIGSSTFFANFQYFRAKKVFDPILTNTFFSYGFICCQ